MQSCTILALTVQLQAIMFSLKGQCYPLSPFIVHPSTSTELHFFFHSLWDHVGLQFIHHISNCHKGASDSLVLCGAVLAHNGHFHELIQH